MKLEDRHQILPMTDEHVALLAMASFKGVDTSPMVDGKRYVGYGKTTSGYGPVCILDVKETPYVTEPHVTWLPWVSAKEKIRAFLFAMGYYSRDKQVLIITGKEQMKFFDHFSEKKVLRKIGSLTGLPKEVGEEIVFYQVNRKSFHE